MSNNSPGSPSDSSPRIPVDVRRFPWIRRLATDYAYDFGSVAPFFAGDPSSHADWAAAIARAQAHPRFRTEIASVVTAQQQRRRAPAPAIEAAARLGDAKTVAIVTGQQAGLFGGPLYTLLKALTALKLARQVSHDHGTPTVAIFWVEAEDHDWDEVRSCAVFDAQLAPRTVSLPALPPSGDPFPVAQVTLDASVQSAIDELAGILPATAFTPELLARLRESYAPGVGMADAFARWLEHVLGDRGLIVYDASDPASKPLCAGVFAHELATASQTARLASASGSDMEARGYPAQVHAQDDSVGVFRLDGTRSPDRPQGARRVIRRRNGGLLIGDQTHAVAALSKEAADRPAGFSPGVLLRPVVQDTLFPTACYVGGPSELAYLGQLRGIYDHFGVPMPLVYPRASATLLDSSAVRFLTKYQLSLEALQPQDDGPLNALLETQMPPAVEQSFQGARDAITAQMTTLMQAVRAIDPTLEGTAKSTLGRMEHDLETFHGKMIQAAKRRHETLRRQFERARALAFPGGHPQERTVGFLSFLNQYGPALVDRLDAELPLDMRHHWIVTI